MSVEKAKLLTSGMIFSLVVSIASAQEDGGLYAPSVWDLTLGEHATELPRDEFIHYACGTNGGPPSLPMVDWRGFDQCRTEQETGFREVYFEYDNELELWARANNLMTQAALYEFTSVNSVPVIASGLFDENGFLVGLRLVSDPRKIDFADEDGRNLAIALSGFLEARFGDVVWDCVDLPRLEGEQEVAGRYEKQACTATTADGHDLYLETHHYRRPGQQVIDPVGNRVTQGEFWSETRFEMTLAEPVADVEQRLAEVDAAVAAAGSDERALLAERALDCPGCDLSGAYLKRADLTGANLEGANLTDANLHEALLRGANLNGAILDGANLNGANLLQVEAQGATFNEVMLYGARLDGGNLAGADLTLAKASRATMARADFSNAVMLAIDLRDARLNDAVFAGADMRFSWLHGAQLTRSDFSGARMSDTLLIGTNFNHANLVGADLYNADLTSADLRFADLTGADLSYAILTYVLLNQTVIDDVNWTGAELPGSLGLE